MPAFGWDTPGAHLHDPLAVGGGTTGSRKPKSRRRPPDEQEQERRREWGKQWGKVNSELAKQMHEREGRK